jgi:hypothetical protein
MRLLKVAAVGLLVAGGVALAHEGAKHHGEFMHRHISQKIEGALDAAQATPDQRARIEKAKDRVFASIEASHQNRKAHMEKVLALFETDKLDPAQIQSLRADHEAAAKADGEAILGAITEAHDTLNAQQRKAVADYIKAHKPEAPPKAVGEWFKKRAFSHVNDALEQVKASQEQRVAVENALEQVWNAVKDEHEASAGHIDQALALFQADKLDPGQIAKLRAEHQARRQKIGDAIVQAFHDVHDALTSAQRKQLVAWVRTNHPHM